jgi:hypothetical protein
MVLKNLFNEHTDDKHYGPSTKVHYTDDDSSQIKIGDADPATKGASITAYVDPTYVGCEFASNCYFDGTNWQRYDVSKPCHSLYHDTANDRTSVWRAAPAANPITNWVQHTILEADAANGIAGLNAFGEVLANGSKIHLKRSGINEIILHERTSGEDSLIIVRVGANDYTGYLKSGGSSSKIQLENMKNTVGGFSGLVATPASASATGTAGQIAYDASYFYVCIATNTWERTALSTW